jgi:hypothetical protein
MDSVNGDPTGDRMFTGEHRCLGSQPVLTVRDGPCELLAAVRPRP